MSHGVTAPPTVIANVTTVRVDGASRAHAKLGKLVVDVQKATDFSG